jgi:hypothetical protein
MHMLKPRCVDNAHEVTRASAHSVYLQRAAPQAPQHGPQALSTLSRQLAPHHAMQGGHLSLQQTISEIISERTLMLKQHMRLRSKASVTFGCVAACISARAGDDLLVTLKLLGVFTKQLLQHARLRERRQRDVTTQKLHVQQIARSLACCANVSFSSMTAARCCISLLFVMIAAAQRNGKPHM